MALNTEYSAAVDVKPGIHFLKKLPLLSGKNSAKGPQEFHFCMQMKVRGIVRTQR
jgi:hypothetical protein